MKTRKYIKRKKNRKYKTKKGGRTKKNILNRLTKVKNIINKSKRNYNLNNKYRILKEKYENNKYQLSSSEYNEFMNVQSELKNQGKINGISM